MLPEPSFYIGRDPGIERVVGTANDIDAPVNVFHVVVMMAVSCFSLTNLTILLQQKPSHFCTFNELTPLHRLQPLYPLLNKEINIFLADGTGMRCD